MFQKTLFIFIFLLVFKNSYAAIDQILNDNFFQNPAELSLVSDLKLLAGNVFINPRFQFTGDTAIGKGHANSGVNDFLPYLLTDYRINEKWVLGFNIVPSAYGHLDWPINSIVAQDATVTNILYYRYGLQSSYQITDKLSIGAGLNLQSNQHYELDFVVAGLGNEINSISGFNGTVDLGLYYKITPQHAFTAAYYSPVNNKTGHGKSILNSAINPNFTLNINEADVAFVGLQHDINQKWFIEEKIYWSGWSRQKNIYFNNTTTGGSV